MNYRFRRKLIISAIFLQLFIFMMQFAVAFASSKFINDSSVAKRWIFFVSDLFPIINNYESYSEFSLVTALFFTVSISFFAIQTILFALIFYFGAPEHGGQIPIKMYFLLAISATIIFISLFFLPKDPALIGSFGMNSSRIGLAFFGVGQFGLLSLITGLFVSEILIFFNRQ